MFNNNQRSATNEKIDFVSLINWIQPTAASLQLVFFSLLYFYYHTTVTKTERPCTASICGELSAAGTSIILLTFKNTIMKYNRNSVRIIGCLMGIFFLSFLNLKPISAQSLLEDCEDDLILRGPYIQAQLHEISGQTLGTEIRWRTGSPEDSRIRISYNNNNNFGNNQYVTGDTITKQLIELIGGNIYEYEDSTYYDFVHTIPPSSNVNRIYYEIDILDDGQYKTSDCRKGDFIPINPTDQPDEINVWVIGDGGDKNFDKVANAYYKYTKSEVDSTDLCLMLGDNAYLASMDIDNGESPEPCTNSNGDLIKSKPDGTDFAHQKNLFEPLKKLLRNVPITTAIGNHEIDYEFFKEGSNCNEADNSNIHDFFDIFPQTIENGGYYSFDHGPAHFVCLNSEIAYSEIFGADALQDMKNWLINDLSNNTKKWTVAFFHHPVISGGMRRDRNTGSQGKPESDVLSMKNTILPELENFGVDLILNGHNHFYERSYLINPHDSTVVDWGSVNEKVDFYEKDSDSNEGSIIVTCGNSSKTTKLCPSESSEKINGVRHYYHNMDSIFNHPLCKQFYPTDTLYTSDPDDTLNVKDCEPQSPMHQALEPDSIFYGGRGISTLGSCRLTINNNELRFKFIAPFSSPGPLDNDVDDCDDYLDHSGCSDNDEWIILDEFVITKSDNSNGGGTGGTSDCPELLELDGTVSNSKTEQAINIESIEEINGGTVSYIGENSITLLTDFISTSNSVFLAKIEECGSENIDIFGMYPWLAALDVMDPDDCCDAEIYSYINEDGDDNYIYLQSNDSCLYNDYTGILIDVNNYEDNEGNFNKKWSTRNINLFPENIPYYADWTKGELLWSCDGSSNRLDNSLDIISEDQIRLLPNPASNQVTIQLNQKFEEVATIQILDISGRVVKTVLQSEVVSEGIYNLQVDVSDLKSGIYLCTLQSNYKIKTSKLVISK